MTDPVGPVMPLRTEAVTFGAAFADAVHQFAEREAYIDGDLRLSYAQWGRRARAVAGLMRARGVRRGDVVALMLGSSADYAICYAAAGWLGAVVTGLNTRLGPHEVEAVLARSGAVLVVRDGAAGLPQVPAGPVVIDRSELSGASEDGPAEPEDVDPGDAAVIIWTSGTTGLPKGAWFDHRNLASAARTAGVMSSAYDRKLVGTPFAHAGYMAKVWDQLAWGMTIVVSPTPWKVEQMADMLRTERITVAGGVPTQWEKLLAHVDSAGLGPLEDVRVGIVATAPASPELVRRVSALLGVPLVVRYAMTESPSIAGTEPDDPPEVQATTVGRPQDGMSVRLLDEQGDDVPTGEVGRVHVRGPAVMRGYWRDEEQTAAAFDGEGWLRSGDLGLMTADGNLTLAGRTGDMYIRGGFNVYPLEVENVLAAHPKVGQVAVVAQPAEVIGEVGVAVVVPADPADPPTTAELRGWVGERLADYKRPDHVVLVEELPLTAMLKIDRRAVVDSLADVTLTRSN